MSEESSCLIVLGMHRSGTSFMGRWMVESGFDFGGNLVPGGIGNQDGHYEDMDFHDLHEGILSRCGIPYGGFERFDDLVVDDRSVAEIQGLITKKASTNQYWGWKEPRTCLFLREYEKLLPNAKVVVIYRDVEKVVSSLIKRDEKKYFRKRGKGGIIKRTFYKLKYRYIVHRSGQLEKYKNSWVRYNTNIAKYLSKKNKNDYIVVDFHDIKYKEGAIKYFIERNFEGVRLNPLNAIFKSERISAFESELSIDCSHCDQLADQFNKFIG